MHAYPPAPRSAPNPPPVGYFVKREPGAIFATFRGAPPPLGVLIVCATLFLAFLAALIGKVVGDPDAENLGGMVAAISIPVVAFGLLTALAIVRFVAHRREARVIAVQGWVLAPLRRSWLLAGFAPSAEELRRMTPPHYYL